MSQRDEEERADAYTLYYTRQLLRFCHEADNFSTLISSFYDLASNCPFVFHIHF